MGNFAFASTHKNFTAAFITTLLTFGIAAPLLAQAHTVVNRDSDQTVPFEISVAIL